jgi:hypothetical protein
LVVIAILTLEEIINSMTNPITHLSPEAPIISVNTLPHHQDVTQRLLLLLMMDLSIHLSLLHLMMDLSIHLAILQTVIPLPLPHQDVIHPLHLMMDLSTLLPKMVRSLLRMAVNLPKMMTSLKMMNFKTVSKPMMETCL